MKINYLFKFTLILYFILILPSQSFGQITKRFLYKDCAVTEEMGEIPEEIFVEIYPIIISKIDELESAYEYQFYLGYSFEIDRNLPYCFFESESLKEGIFNPYFEFMNAIDIERTTSFGVEIENNEVYVEARYKGKIKGNFDFTLYPFDKQNLHLDISSTYSRDDFSIQLEDQKNSLLDKLEVQGWDKVNFNTQILTEKSDQENEEYDLIRYEIELKRQVFSISLRLFLPLLVIVSLNFLSLILERNDFETKVDIQLAALIAIAAYSILMDTKIPDLPYLTIADTFIALSFFSSAFILALSILKKRRRDKKLAEKE